MSATDLLQVDVIGELHVLRVNTKGRADRVGTVSRDHHDNIRARLEAIHKGEQLRDDATLDLAIRLLMLRRNGVDLVDENDGRRVLLRLLEPPYS